MTDELDLQPTVTQIFTEKFGTPPTFVVRAPGRVNLIGEHTDYNDGFVLPMAIERAIWIALRPRDDDEVHVQSLDLEETAVFSLSNLQKEETRWIEYLKGCAWALQEAGYSLRGWEGVMSGNVPLGSGLSSSAALEMATTRAFAIVSGWAWPPKQMALLGQKVENEWMGANTGIMDQLISATGEADRALLIDCRSLALQPVPLPLADDGSKTAVVILDTMTRHSHVDSGYNERREQCEAGARFFGVKALRDVTLREFLEQEEEMDPIVRKRSRHVISENVRTLNAATAMKNVDAVLLGRLMNDSHISMRDDFEISRWEMDAMVEIAQAQAACFGARMTGGGFGGCAVALVREDGVEEFVRIVAADYEQKTNLTPNIYVTRAASGATVLLSPS